MSNILHNKIVWVLRFELVTLTSLECNFGSKYKIQVYIEREAICLSHSRAGS